MSKRSSKQRKSAQRRKAAQALIRDEMAKAAEVQQNPPIVEGRKRKARKNRIGS